MAESKEYSTILNCNRKLEIALKSDRDIALFLLQQGFITQERYDEINNPKSNLTDDAKASMLVTAIRDRVELNPRNYHKVVDHLRQNMIRYGDIIEILDQQYHQTTTISNPGTMMATPSPPPPVSNASPLTTPSMTATPIPPSVHIEGATSLLATPSPLPVPNASPLQRSSCEGTTSMLATPPPSSDSFSASITQSSVDRATISNDNSGGPSPVLTEKNVKVILLRAGVEWTFQLCVGGLRLREKRLKKVQKSTPEEKWKFTIDYWLNIDPTPSWRRMICAVDYYAKQYEAASRLYQYAEPVTDSTLTLENVLLVLKEVKNLTMLCRYLRVPENKRNRIDETAIAKYFIFYCCHPTWLKLAGKLYFLNEDRALGIVHRFIPTSSPDPTLTVESMYEVLKKVDWNRGLRGEKIDIPWSQCTDIKKQYKGNPIECSKVRYEWYLDFHPAPSWDHIAEGLYQAREHYIVKQVERRLKAARRLAACRQAIKEKTPIDETVVHSIFCGLAGSGKSSLMSRLVRADADKNVTERTIKLEEPKLSKSVVLVEGLSWNKLDFISEADMIANKISPSTLSRVSKRRKDSWIHYLSDVKGQPEFQEHLHVLISGHSLFYHTFRADVDLDAEIELEHLSPSGKSFKTSTTTKESILQFLATISSIAVTKKPQEGNLAQPKVFFIATHVNKSKGKIKIIDQKLQEIVKTTKAYKDGMVVYCSEASMLFPVNNCSDNDNAFRDIRIAVNRVVTGNKDYRISVPHTWSLFSARIQHFTEQVLSYDTCLAVGKECGIDTTEDLDSCLWFLHHQTGILRYFKEVPELQDLIINNPQYIFDRITDLITNTFIFDKIRGDMRIKDEFSKKGIFSVESFEKLSCSDDLSSSQLIKLFEHLHIIAPVEKSPDGVIKKYFLPCALSRLDSKDTPAAEVSSQSHPSLFFLFGCGYSPYGLFGALVTDLFHPSPDSEFEWTFENDEIFRNQICFSVGPLSDKFQFTVALNHICIDVLRESNQKKPALSKICDHVRQHIENSLSDMISVLNYTIDPEEAFQCPIHSSHLAYIRFFQNRPLALKCSIQNKTTEFPAKCSIWFDEAGQGLTSHLGIEDLEDVIEEVGDISAKWKQFATKLHLHPDLLDRIGVENQGSVVMCLRVALKEWLKKNYNVKKFGEPTWKMLVDAVKARYGGADTALAEKMTESLIAKERLKGLPRQHSEPPLSTTRTQEVKKPEKASSFDQS